MQKKLRRKLRPNVINQIKLMEIEEAKLLGRSARRKEQTRLRKKYNDKNIKISSNKTFKKGEKFNRQQRRNIIKNKNLLIEVVKIITKYFPLLLSLLDKLTDKRHKSYVSYSIRTIILTRLFSLICGVISMNGMSRSFNTENAIKNLSSICHQNLIEIPHWQTIQDVIEQLDIEEIRGIRRYMVKAIVRSKMFDNTRYNGAFQLLVDATGVSSHSYNLNNTCITKKTKNGALKYYKYVLEAKLVVGNIVISVDSEWIENSTIKTEKQKQDCEINAFKRMAPRIKKEFPKMKFIITGDALYATKPTIDICKNYKWDYIFNLKKNRLKQIYQDFEDDINYQNEVTKENYYLSSNINYKGIWLRAFRFYDKETEKEFNYISNLKVTNHNIDKIVKMGRKRWKIENEGFNEQKNGTFCISHLSSRNENAIKIHYYLIQIAHIIRQLLEYGSIVLREMRLQKKEVSSHIKNDLTTFNSTSKLNTIETNFQLRFDELIL